MTTAARRSRPTAKRAATTTAKSPTGGAARGRGSGSKTTRGAKKQTASSGAGHHDHGLTITIPVDSAASAVGKAVSLPVTAAQRILPAKGGLPLYAGLGALGIAGILEW